MTTGKRILYSVFAGLIPMLMFAHKNGPDPRHTAAPGDDPLACATSGCHTGLPKGGPLNAYGGNVTATFSNGSFYTPGQAITITVSVSDPNPPESMWHGFQMSARLESDLVNGQAGTFRFTDPGLLDLCDDGSVSGYIKRGNTPCPANAPVEFIEHSMPSTGTWTFTWIPPADGSVPVHFYIAGNAVNLNDQPDAGDHVYTKEYVLRPLSGTCAQTLPTITTVRRIEGWGDGTTFSSGSWLEIKGSNLAQATGTWLDADFNAGVAALPSLGGTSVSVNGVPGLVEYISPTQINLQAPADPATTGLVPVTVTNCAGISKAFTDPNLQKVPLAPGILAPFGPPSIPGIPSKYAMATFGFSALFVGNLPGLPSRPAKPGESILLYAIGLGDTTPANTPGVIATGQEVLNAPIVVKFGSTAATGVRAVMYPTFVGLYYITLTVPATLADGDYQINITIGGQPLQQQPFFLTVHQ
jgi:uncharacterized protein (TIGR03437 family)